MRYPLLILAVLSLSLLCPLACGPGAQPPPPPKPDAGPICNSPPCSPAVCPDGYGKALAGEPCADLQGHPDDCRCCGHACGGLTPADGGPTAVVCTAPCL